MDHVIEPASSGRAKCRGCGRAIAKGELRLGERLPNPFTDEGEMTHRGRHCRKMWPPLLACFFMAFTRTPLRIQISSV